MRQTAAIVLFATALALVSSAAAKEIPQQLLDHEARARAALSPAERAHVDALVPKLSPKMSVQDVTRLAGGGGDSGAGLFVVMVQYLKLVDKEARENHRLDKYNERLALASKAGKLDLEKTKIDAEKREAEERYDRAMAAAEAQMKLGIASAASQVNRGALLAPTPTRTPVPARK
jgi:hypothetical protein